VLKGSGTVIASPQEVPVINHSGNARLATAGTGDVLAGMTGAALAAGRPAMVAACEAVWRHGDLADRWPADVPLTAGALACGRLPAASC
jgi:NAD(P)H-hydrate repair Nnr-like enzyme with NAD(P)H-hydrate dehydratase domain